MNTVSVAEGDIVQQGDTIGTIGATGRATGPHVDWRINWGSVRLDPRSDNRDLNNTDSDWAKEYEEYP